MRIIKFIKNYKYQLMMSLILIVITITIFNFGNNKYKRKFCFDKINREVFLHPYDSFYGKSFVTDTYPIFKEVVFIGDSYAHKISSNLGFDLTNYSCPGFTVSELNHVVDVASKSNKKFAVIFIGPNDFGRKTELSDFHDTLKLYIDTLKKNNINIIILPTYLHSGFTKDFEERNEAKYTVDEYNDEILKLTKENQGVYYFDISDMDEHLDKYQNDPDDIIHFNFDFAVDYINKLYRLLIDIKKKEIDIYNG